MKKDVVAKNWIKHALPVLLGALAFYAVVGPRALYPSNLGWLGQGDPATYYLGWLSYRHSPWSFPIGLNPSYGLELANAILYSDSNPLFAFLFKPFSALLPEPFQYFGIWLFLCFVLQAWFGWKLVGLISETSSIRILGAGLFVFAPPMLWRLHGHFSLVGQFIVLAALYLALRPTQERRLVSWGAVLATGALVHAYLLAMAGTLWLADLVWQSVARKQSMRRSINEALVLVALVAFACWQAGYFSFGRGVFGDGYGFYRMNLLSIIDSSSWSYVLKDIPEKRGDYEGFNFLGLGVIALLLVSVPTLVAGRVRFSALVSRKPILLFALTGLALFALSNKVGVGTFGFEYSMNNHLEKLANMFRGSGRMFWPVYYAIVLAAIYFVVRGNDERTAAALLALAFVVQAIDTSAGWRPIRESLMARPKTQWATPLQARFWSEAARRYTKVRVMPPGNNTSRWQILADYAGAHGLATDAVYLARVSTRGLAAAQAKAATSLRTGVFEKDSLYVLDENVAALIASKIDPNADLLATIDGFDVLAPGWKQCRECSPVDGEVPVRGLPKPVKSGERVEFTKSGAGAAYLVAGWSVAEPWGTWSDGRHADILLPLSGKARRFLVEAHPLLSSSHPKQKIEIRVNGILSATVTLTESSGSKVEVSIPDAVKRDMPSTGALLRLGFDFPTAARPKDLGMNDDTRSLALGLQAITVF